MKKYLYGIELEAIVLKSKENGFYNRVDKIKNWEVDDDSSIVHDYEEESIEMKFDRPLNYKDAKKAVKIITTLCKNKEITVNDSCGYHLHMSHKDMGSPKKVNRIVKLWISLEDFLYSTQPQKRTKNSFCKRKLQEYVLDEELELPRQKEELLDKVADGDRYFAINLAALNSHGTIEIRLHAGTIDKNEIINWLELMTKFFDYALSKNYDKERVEKLFQMKISPAKVLKIYDLLGLPDPLRAYYNRKIHKSYYSRLGTEQRAANEILKIRVEEAEIAKIPYAKRISKSLKLREKRRIWQNKLYREYDR